MNHYEKYKPSGINWIGEIPNHWQETKLKYLGYLYAGLTGKSGDDFKQIDNPQNKPFIPFTNIANNLKINPNQLDKVIMSEDDVQNKVKKNDLFFMMSSENFDDVGKATILLNDLGECYLNSFCKGFRVTDNNVYPPYLNYLLLNDGYRRRLMIEANGFTRINLKMEKVNDFEISLPPLEEQTAIANFLDEKTTQIDKLISKKQKLIELLKEERTAIINEAVSGKGKNWEKKKLKYVALIKYGLGQPPKQKDDGLPLIRATNVERGKINEKDLIFVDPDDVPYERDPVLKENDIIVVRSGAYTADSAIIPKKFEGAITGYDMVVRVVNDNPFYIAFCLLSDDVLINQLYLQRLRAAQPHLNKEELGETLFNMPTLKEQTTIVQHIQTETQRIDNLISKIEKEIELMNEYRTALISEVVTGKIKVV